jgi:spore maturation protein CgeB
MSGWGFIWQSQDRRESLVKIVFFGLSLSSAWGNGHATTYRALLRALHARRHQIVFFERDFEWYASNRDLPEPSFCTLEVYKTWESARSKIRQELREADVAVVGSYFPDGIAALNEILDSRVAVKAFYDIDTPITVSHLRNGGASYVTKEQLTHIDLYFSFTGGPLLAGIETELRIRKAVPLYCSFDPDLYYPGISCNRYHCDLSYMGTYAPDRQTKLEQLFRQTALASPDRTFYLAGAQYPQTFWLPENVRHILHVSPNDHAEFYSASRITLNLTRQEMVKAGYSPSVRLFEAAACGSAIISDLWPGLDTFFIPGDEILVAQTTEHVQSYLQDFSPEELASIGRRARERALADHHPARRAEQFERAIAYLPATVF